MLETEIYFDSVQIEPFREGVLRHCGDSGCIVYHFLGDVQTDQALLDVGICGMNKNLLYQKYSRF
ncbi:MAG: hypothetical protein II341_06600, partial [Oscillospiraceae bacterium]|nr:hypothetical protein [Oscillospiraceae bacterium]